ncbi:MAG: hypothetical protein ABR498_01915 [Candidatus Dormibacteria bacterium]
MSSARTGANAPLSSPIGTGVFVTTRTTPAGRSASRRGAVAALGCIRGLCAINVQKEMMVA